MLYMTRESYQTRYVSIKCYFYSNVCDYISMLGLKLNHVGKRATGVQSQHQQQVRTHYGFQLKNTSTTELATILLQRQ